MKKESVWDYPRPPRMEPVEKQVRIEFGGIQIANSSRAIRVLETSHPPVYYIPQEDIRMDLLRPASGQTSCEWKGFATYWTVKAGGREAVKAAWSYEKPSRGFEAIRDHLAFYARKMDACFVGEESVVAQTGDFYGGWITSEIEL